MSPEPKDIPVALHSHVIDGGDGERDTTADRLGGKKFSGAFQAYMSGVLPHMVAEEKHGWMRWWEVSYVMGRLYARFGKDVVDAVLRIERDDVDLAVVAIESGFGRVKLCRDISRVRKLSQSYFHFGVTHQKIRLAKHVRDGLQVIRYDADDYDE